MSGSDHFRSALYRMHEDFIVFIVLFFQIHRSIPDFSVRFSGVLQQKFLIEAFIILTIHQTHLRIDSERFELLYLFFPGGLRAVFLPVGRTACALRNTAPIRSVLCGCHTGTFGSRRSFFLCLMRSLKTYTLVSA